MSAPKIIEEDEGEEDGDDNKDEEDANDGVCQGECREKGEDDKARREKQQVRDFVQVRL